MTNPKIAICTTFPNDYWNICAAQMLAGIKNYWPEGIKVYVQLDEQSPEEFQDINNKIMEVVGEDRVYIASLWDDDQKDFMERWKDHKPESYLFDVVRFSHKVFALEKCADALKDDYDYLIWLDADVITKKPLDYEWLKEVLPGEDEVCSYLGRNYEDNLVDYSECGWVAYNLKAGAYDLLGDMKDMYAKDNIKNFKTGWTDCHVFDAAHNGLPAKNLSEGVKGTDVWPFTKLAEKMVHRKGNRKVKTQDAKGKIPVVDANNLQIKTKNCLDHKKIRQNVNKNVSQIRSWVTICQPTRKGSVNIDDIDEDDIFYEEDVEMPQEEIVICSAGPSLVYHIDEIKEHQRNGAKIVAVKHALETLEAHGVKPWACVLLDPRAHVEGFIKKPDPDVVYFVASMCDPSVVRTLNDNKCAVIGYHALVNAGEIDELIPCDLPISGGSATATRSIAIFADMFGYTDFHLYGYDLCLYQKPNLAEINEDGNPKYLEVNIGVHSYDNQYLTRTFWTEGQFLAQSNELRNLCKDREDLNITIYGDGMAGWLYRHDNLYKKFKDDYNARIEEQRKTAPTVDEFVNGCTRGTNLIRNV